MHLIKKIADFAHAKITRKFYNNKYTLILLFNGVLNNNTHLCIMADIFLKKKKKFTWLYVYKNYSLIKNITTIMYFF